MDRFPAVLPLLIACFLQVVAASSVPASFHRRVGTAGATEVVVRMAGGSLSVQGRGGPEIEVTSPSSGMEDALHINRDGDRIVFEVVGSGARQAAEIHLDVPKSSRLTVETTSAGVAVSGVEGDLEIQTDTGDIDLRAGSGGRAVKIATVAGMVDVVAEVRSLVIDTVSGGVRFRGRAALIVSTVSGSVRIEGQLRDSSEILGVSARVDLEGDLAPGARLKVSSHTGDVTLTLERREPVSFALSTFTGRITSNGQRVRPGERGGDVFLGAKGAEAGTRRVEIGTFSGAISLRYLSEP